MSDRGPGAAVPVSLQAWEIQEVEILEDNWQRMKLDCPICNESLAVVFDVHFGEDKKSDTFIAVTKKCRGCGVKIEGREDAI